MKLSRNKVVKSPLTLKNVTETGFYESWYNNREGEKELYYVFEMDGLLYMSVINSAKHEAEVLSNVHNGLVSKINITNIDYEVHI